MFDDRRTRTDRRVRRDPAAIPPSGCRRHNDRRNRRRTQAHAWWLQADYVEEMEPPLLQSDAESDDKEPRAAVSHGLLPTWFAQLRLLGSRGGA